MCAGCADWLGSCSHAGCGAKPRLDEDGVPRQRYLQHFYLDEVPCAHVLEGHAATCKIRTGRFCDCSEEDDL